MADHLRNLKQKLRPEISDEPKAKNRDPIGIEVNATGAEVLTNICTELIDRIFDFLDVQSLLNVAGTCKRLQVAAAAKYGQKFSRYPTRLRSKKILRDVLLRKQCIQFEIDVVEAFGRPVLPFLRCFGAQINELQVNTLDNNHVARYINQYCADTLTEMRFYEFDEETFTIKNCPKPFKMMERVSIIDLSNQFSNFAYWFPNIRKLSLSTKRFDYDVSSAVFLQMEELSLVALHGSHSEKRQIERFVRANKQLRCLEIRTDNLHFWKLLKMLSGHTLISKLRVTRLNFYGERVMRNLLMRFAREHRELVELDFPVFLLKAVDVIAFIRELSSLKYFRFGLKDHSIR